MRAGGRREDDNQMQAGLNSIPPQHCLSQHLDSCCCVHSQEDLMRQGRGGSNTTTKSNHASAAFQLAAAP